MAAPSIRLIRNCYQPVSRALIGAPTSARVQEGAPGRKARAHIVERTSGKVSIRSI